MTARGPAPRTAGWVLAGTAATALLCGAAAMALAAEWQEPVLFVDLGALPPAAPAVAAVAESAPQVMDSPPPTPDEPTPVEDTPDLPEADVAPELAAASPVALPVPEVPVEADLVLPPPPEKPEPKVEEKKPVETPKPKKKKEKAAEKPKEKKTETAEKPKETRTEEASAASAPKAGSTTKKGGAVSPAAYAKAVKKKIRATRQKSGHGKGLVVVGFSIAADGGLAGVQVLQSSGNATLDKIALDHIRRSAPFPPPPEGASRSYQQEFEYR